MQKRTWITVGAAGTLGLGLVATGAMTAANAMDVSTEAGATRGVAVTGASLDGTAPVTVRVSDDGHASVASAPTAASATTAPTASTAPSAATPASSPTAQSPASVPSAQTPASVPSAQSAQSAQSPQSAPSND